MKFKLFSSAKPLTCALINKVLSFFCGCLFIGLAFLTAKGASIIQLSTTVFGIAFGLIFGVFILGICFPISNIKGAVGGMLVSFFKPNLMFLSTTRFLTSESVLRKIHMEMIGAIKKRSEVPPELLFNWSKLFSKHGSELSEDLILNVKE
ncbi:putative sodium-dependent multivitamin transporter [Armadillidium vulgare]|nr:putative sodium-dependent multivitamin transporter [Armadillidium vulgare]